MTKTVNEIKKYLKSSFLEREEVIDGLLAAIVAKENVLLIGPPGTAKSNLIIELSKCITDINYFQWLLTKYTVPEEVFGALSLKELEQGIYKRNITGKLPEAHIAFLDEIFKASSAILNALLTLINEGLFYNNGQPMQCPLMTVIGASNEYAEEEEGLDALDDRFVLRYEVNHVRDNSNFMQILKNGGVNTTNPPQLDIFDLITLQQQAESVKIENQLLETIQKVKDELEKEEIEASTRRWVKAVKMVKTMAALDGRQDAEFTDLEILKHVLWRDPKHKKDVQAIVKKYCTDQISQALQEFIIIAEDVYRAAMEQKTTEAGTEANKKIKNILKDIEAFKSNNPSRQTTIEGVEEKIKNLNAEMLSACLGL